MRRMCAVVSLLVATALIGRPAAQVSKGLTDVQGIKVGHHTLTESSFGGSPPRTSYTYRSTSHGKTAAMRTSENTPSETV